MWCVASPARLTVRSLVEPVSAWGRQNRRELPWRRTRDPWAVLVSEVMLQQTQVGRVVDRFGPFLESYPDPASCAAAPLGEVLVAWQGLGYPRRARDLHRAAAVIVERHAGRVPCDRDALLALPGVGRYTARAVRVFAFAESDAVVDTNVGRLLARWSGRPLAAAEAQVMADRLVADAVSAGPEPTVTEAAGPGAAWAWNQALFDLGAMVCTKRQPACARCPVATRCAWRGAGCPAPDPAAGSAAVSRRQARFAGSDRELRGRLLRLAAEGTTSLDEAVVSLGETRERTVRVATALAAEGLLAPLAWRGDACLRLPR
jgi:A/G-specific adenine glycosylase